jgi:hypothetical protein
VPIACIVYDDGWKAKIYCKLLMCSVFIHIYTYIKMQYEPYGATINISNILLRVEVSIGWVWIGNWSY